MRYRTYTRKVAARRSRFVNGPSECRCWRCTRPTAQPRRPADYEPDYDGPTDLRKRATWSRGW